MRNARLTFTLAATLLIMGPAAFLFAAEGQPPQREPATPVEAFLGSLDAAAGGVRKLDTPETLALFGVGAGLGLNVFELLDAVHRWALPARVRLSIPGEALHEATRAFDMGRERVRSLLPLDLMTGLEIGAILSPGQDALAATLAEPYSEYVELGTIKLSTSFGFGELEPGRFLKPHGIAVARFPVVASLDRLELYAPRKGAIYVSGIPKPKRWNLWPITRR